MIFQLAPFRLLKKSDDPLILSEWSYQNEKTAACRNATARMHAARNAPRQRCWRFGRFQPNVFVFQAWCSACNGSQGV